MNDEIQRKVRPYLSSGVLVDSNILILLIIGRYKQQLITRFGRTRKFTVEDFATLENFLKPFARILTTPQVLAEVNGLSNDLPNDFKHDYYQVFAAQIATFSELSVPSTEAIHERVFYKLGLTDAGIMWVARKRYLVLTDDWPLAGQIENEGGDVINFNHLRRYT